MGGKPDLRRSLRCSVVSNFEIPVQRRMLKKRIIALLKSPDFPRDLESMAGIPIQKILGQLFAALCSEEEEIKWRAVSIIGIKVASLAETDREGARAILRRMIGLLNEESGGIGWGIPEAMGEVLARNANLAREFAPILISFIRRDGNFLEFELLQRGVLWGIGRLAEAQPQRIQSLGAETYLRPYLSSSDSSVRGLAAWVLGLIGGGESIPHLKDLLQDEAEIKFYKDRKFQRARVREVVSQSLASIRRRMEVREEEG